MHARNSMQTPRRAFGVPALTSVAANVFGVDSDLAALLGGPGPDSVEQALFGLHRRAFPPFPKRKS